MCISESLPILNMTPVILKTLYIKYIFMGVNRKFDFRQDWMFCSDLGNVISGGNLLFWWDCFFRWDFVPFCEPWTLNSPNDLKCGITLMVFTLDQCLIPCLMWTCGLLITFCMPISMMWAIWVNIFGSPPRPPPPSLSLLRGVGTFLPLFLQLHSSVQSHSEVYKSVDCFI